MVEMKPEDPWNPTNEELDTLIEYCLPLDDNFGDRVFYAILDGTQWPAASLNIFYEVRDRLDSNCPDSFTNMVEGFESGLEDY
jgi:hypothetical protein